MRRSLLLTLVVVCFLSVPFLAGKAIGEEAQDKGLRSPMFAGTWYPGDPTVLRQTITGYLSKADPPVTEGKVVAIIVPHAGYLYSGQVAAYSYKLLQRNAPKLVFLIGPSHRVGFRGFSVSRYSGYKTPLGVAPVDEDLSKKLLSINPQMRWVPEADGQEHSLEIQIPFLQTVLKDFHIVSHFHTDQQARALDGEFIKQVREFNPESLAKAVASGSCEACGAGPTITAMLAARELGANRSVILHYANSGDVTNDRRQVVGYLSAALLKAP
jgi:predicted class III extradiol MEMO1 family dioxygenase